MEYKCVHIDLDSESNATKYINAISQKGWKLVHVFNQEKFGHPLCIFEKEPVAPEEKP